VLEAITVVCGKYRRGVRDIKGWASQDIVLLRGFCARINHPVITPPDYIARTIAVLLRVFCAIYDASPTPLLYAIHHIQSGKRSAMAISCEGQIEEDNGGGVRDIEGDTAGSQGYRWRYRRGDTEGRYRRG